jgi:hypothetical protein
MMDQATIAALNSLLANATPWSAFCMGAVTHMAKVRGLDPDRTLLEAAATCTSIEEADRCFERWLE